MIVLLRIGEMLTWWLLSTAAPQIPLCRANSQQLGITVDTLHVPGASDDGQHSPVSDVDPLVKQSRSRSNSVKSHNSSSKSAQVFQRAGSFRHKIKSDSLSSTHVSEDNIIKVSGSVAAGFLADGATAACKLLPNRERAASPKNSLNNNNSSIVIQVDQVY